MSTALTHEFDAIAPPPPSDESPGALASNAALVLGSQMAANVGYFIAVLELARGLDPSGRGTVAFVSVTAMIMARVVNIGVDEATLVQAAQRPSKRPQLLSNLVLTVTATALVGGVVVSGSLLLFDGRPAGLDHTGVILLGATFVASGLGSAGLAFLRGCSRFRAYAGALLMAPWMYAGGLAITWVAVGLTPTRAIALWIAAHLLAALIQLSLSARRVGVRAPDQRLLAESLRFGVRAWAGGLSWAVNARVDQVLLGLMAAESVLGVYAVAVNASEVLFYLPAAVAYALVPFLATRGGDMREHTLGALRSVLIFVAAASATAGLLGAALLPVVFGDAYSSSVGPYLWLLPAALGFSAAIVLSHALMAANKPGLSSVGPVVAVALLVLLDLLLIPAHGATGAAIACSGAWIGGGLAAIAAHRWNDPWPWRSLVPGRADVVALVALARRRGAAPA